jgi:hypothetical protein
LSGNDRYVLVETRGFAARGGKGASSFSILDSCSNYEEVYVSYAGYGGKEENRRAACKAKLKAMNADERRWEKNG